MAYFPNGTSGGTLDDQCSVCKLGGDQHCCPVLLVQLTHNYDQVKKGQELLRHAMNLLVSEKGVCQLKAELDKLEEPQEYDIGKLWFEQ